MDADAECGLPTDRHPELAVVVTARNERGVAAGGDARPQVHTLTHNAPQHRPQHADKPTGRRPVYGLVSAASRTAFTARLGNAPAVPDRCIDKHTSRDSCVPLVVRPVRGGSWYRRCAQAIDQRVRLACTHGREHLFTIKQAQS